MTKEYNWTKQVLHGVYKWRNERSDLYFTSYWNFYYILYLYPEWETNNLFWRDRRPLHEIVFFKKVMHISFIILRVSEIINLIIGAQILDKMEILNWYFFLFIIKPFLIISLDLQNSDRLFWLIKFLVH